MACARPQVFACVEGSEGAARGALVSFGRLARWCGGDGGAHSASASVGRLVYQRRLFAGFGCAKLVARVFVELFCAGWGPSHALSTLSKALGGAARLGALEQTNARTGKLTRASAQTHTHARDKASESDCGGGGNATAQRCRAEGRENEEPSWPFVVFVVSLSISTRRVSE